MKKNIPFWILSIAASLILSTGLLAQEQIEMSIKVTKDGKVVKDTTYLFDAADKAKHAMKMMEIVSGNEPHKEHVTYNYTTSHTGSGEAKTMVFISEDDDMKVEMKKIMEEYDGVEGANVKVIVIKKGGDLHEDHDKDCDHDEDHDKDCDHDEDSDHEKEIEVKVKKKK